ncbi:hypothetical protein JCM24511_04726 [Saitozyma sp. JCM 24511]|nr:hypothetical protein JCM24511_04726 [Saitozyma sp. JCM 24511]
MLSRWRRAALIALGLVLAASSSVAAASKPALGIKNAKVAVTSPDGLHDATYTLKEPAPLPSPISLGEATTLKLTFTIVDMASGEPVFPQQAHLLFADKKGEEDVTLPVSVKSNGKASFTINTSKLPAALLPTHGTFHLTLLLSSLDAYTPLSYPLGDVSLPPSILKPLSRKRHDLPARPGEPAFQPEIELFHTFRPEEDLGGMGKSLIGTIIALSPWAVLVALITKISPSLNHILPPGSALLWLATLAIIEALIFTYWAILTLPIFLPPFIILCVLSAYAGKVALTDIRADRLKAGGTP